VNSKKAARKKEISIMKQLVEEEALDCYLEYDAEYTFHHFSGDVQTLFVYQAIDSNNPVEFHMLEKLKSRLKKMNSRYMVGIIFQDVPDYEEED
tara:strand:- start:704 stop:985 length:282 start_codon:yes stop_codon:yes gene_type:complete